MGPGAVARVFGACRRPHPTAVPIGPRPARTRCS